MSEELTKAELLEKAKELEVEGRSSMNKDELEKAVAEAEGSSDSEAPAEVEEENPAGAVLAQSADLAPTTVGDDVKQEDVIDYPAPLAEREEAETGEEVKGDETAEGAAGGAFHTEPLGAASKPGVRSRLFEQKAVFYTDGLSGEADHDQTRAYGDQAAG